MISEGDEGGLAMRLLLIALTVAVIGFASAEALVRIAIDATVRPRSGTRLQVGARWITRIGCLLRRTSPLDEPQPAARTESPPQWFTSRVGRWHENYGLRS